MLTPGEAADELQARLDRIVALLRFTHDMQGACCARGRVNAERVVRIACGEDSRIVDGMANVAVQLEIGAGGPYPDEPDVAVAPC